MEGVFHVWGDHATQLHWKSLLQNTEKEIIIIINISLHYVVLTLVMEL